MAGAPVRPTWSCYTGFIVCSNAHLLRLLRTGYKGDIRDVAGHAFLECQQCDPSTFFLAVLSTSPDPHVTCYALSRDCYREWDRRPPEQRTPNTPELLYLVRDPEGRSHNPSWRPPKPKQRP